MTVLLFIFVIVGTIAITIRKVQDETLCLLTLRLYQKFVKILSKNVNPECNDQKVL